MKLPIGIFLFLSYDEKDVRPICETAYGSFVVSSSSSISAKSEKLGCSVQDGHVFLFWDWRMRRANNTSNECFGFHQNDKRLEIILSPTVSHAISHVLIFSQSRPAACAGTQPNILEGSPTLSKRMHIKVNLTQSQP